MTLRECLHRHTWLDYLVWMQWRRNQMNKPSRADYYLMRIAHFISYLPGFKDYRQELTPIEFELVKYDPEMEEARDDYKMQLSKAAAFARFGQKPTQPDEPSTEEEIQWPQ